MRVAASRTGHPPGVPRLKRVDSSSPGIRRRRRGRGFQYVDEDGSRVQDDEVLARIVTLAIPPAWKDVWISVHPMGHIQATGIDDAGRKQYRYHDRWRERRDAQKFQTMLEFAEALPAVRRVALGDLALDGLPREKALACAVRLLDVGFFRVGSEDYAEQNESYGLATLKKSHVKIEDGVLHFDFPAKSRQQREQFLRDPIICRTVSAMRRRRGGTDELLAYKDARGRWQDVRSDDINAYIKQITSGDFSAKDFRTWNATVLMAVRLGRAAERPGSRTARKRVVAAAVKDVAFFLGNTPAVCRASYIDPRVIDRFEGGLTISRPLAARADPGQDEVPSDVALGGGVDAAVIDLIAGHEDSPRVQELPEAA